MAPDADGVRVGKARRRLALLLILLAGVPAGLFLWLQFRTAPYAPIARTLPPELQAARSAGLPLAPGDLRPNPPVTPDQNAAPVYRDIEPDLASRADVRGDQALSDVLRRTRTNPDRARARLAVLAPILALGEEAAARPRCDFGRQWELGPAVLLPEYAIGRALVRAFAARAILKADDGDAAGALKDVVTGARIGRHMGEDPILIALLVQIACHDMVDSAFAEIVVRHGNDLEVLRRATEAERAFGPRPDPRHALGGEIVIGRIGIRQSGEESLPPVPGIRFSPHHRAQILDAWDARGVNWWRRVFAAIEASPEDIRAQQRALAKLGSEEQAKAKQPTYERYAALTPVFAQATLQVVRWEAQDRLRRTLLSLMDYRQRTGRFPDALNELSPPPPLDVFTDKPLVYRRTEESFLLYSVGENGRDDGGKSRSRTGNRGPDDIVIAGP